MSKICQKGRALVARFFQRPQDIADSAQVTGVRGSAEIQRWMQKTIGDELNVAGESLDPTEPFTSYGLDSIAAFTLTLDLADWLERDLPASLLWEYPTIAELAEFLGEENEK